LELLLAVGVLLQDNVAGFEASLGVLWLENAAVLGVLVARNRTEITKKYIRGTSLAGKP